MWTTKVKFLKSHSKAKGSSWKAHSSIFLQTKIIKCLNRPKCLSRPNNKISWNRLLMTLRCSTTTQDIRLERSIAFYMKLTLMSSWLISMRLPNKWNNVLKKWETNTSWAWVPKKEFEMSWELDSMTMMPSSTIKCWKEKETNPSKFTFNFWKSMASKWWMRPNDNWETQLQTHWTTNSGYMNMPWTKSLANRTFNRKKRLFTSIWLTLFDS